MSEHSVGRIDAGAAPSVPRPSAGGAAAAATLPLAARRRPGLVTYAIASAAAGAAAIHFAVTAEHFEEWWLFGLFFGGSAVAQLAWAVVVVASRSRLLIWLGVAGNAAIVVLWVVTRTVGTLVGPEPDTPEPVSVADSVATAFEVVIVVAGTWLGRSVRMRRPRSSELVWVVSGFTFVLTSVALLSVLEHKPS